VPADSPPAPIPLSVPATAGPIALTRPVAPILLEREVVAPRELTVPEGSAWTGEMLRRVRESRGITVQQLAERTRITRHHLENIEQDRFTALPAAVYLRGIIMSLARELRLDGQKVARSYLDRMGGGGDGP
jgi:DNA-binding transcriptional regulator YiaG